MGLEGAEIEREGELESENAREQRQRWPPSLTLSEAEARHGLGAPALSYRGTSLSCNLIQGCLARCKRFEHVQVVRP